MTVAVKKKRKKSSCIPKRGVNRRGGSIQMFKNLIELEKTRDTEMTHGKRVA